MEEPDEADGPLRCLVDSLEIQERDSLKQAQIGLDEKAGVVRTPWLTRTRWMERYEGMDMEELYKLTDKPNLGEEEEWMLTLWSDIGGTIGWCFEGLKDLHERGWDRISFWLASPNQESTNKSPMNIYIQSATVVKYAGYWQKFLCFCLRGKKSGITGLNLTMEQENSLDEMQAMYEDSEREDIERMKRILIWSLRFIKQTVYEVGLPALVFYSGVLGYRRGKGGWRQPEDYTNMLAGMLWCMRVLVLEYALPTASRERLAQDEMNPMERVKLIRDKYLVEENDTPFAALHSLMNYGFVVGKDGVGQTLVSWSQDNHVLYIQGNDLAMDTWKAFLHEMVNMAEDQLVRELMLRPDLGMPDCNLWEIEDDLSTIKLGHYFGRRDESSWAKARREMLDWNMRASDPYGLIGGNYDDGVQFVRTAVDEYQRRDKEWRQKLYILMLATCGPPPRTTEMTSLRVMDSDLGKRNVFVLGGQVMFVTEYHKSQSIVNRQKVRMCEYKVD